MLTNLIYEHGWLDIKANILINLFLLSFAMWTDVSHGYLQISIDFAIIMDTKIAKVAKIILLQRQYNHKVNEIAHSETRFFTEESKLCQENEITK